MPEVWCRACSDRLGTQLIFDDVRTYEEHAQSTLHMHCKDKRSEIQDFKFWYYHHVWTNSGFRRPKEGGLSVRSKPIFAGLLRGMLGDTMTEVYECWLHRRPFGDIDLMAIPEPKPQLQ